MRAKSFQCILGFLSLLGAAYGSTVSVSECTAKAWVRAPDLTPNAIVHGDARVKISAECPAIENVSLGLRFKERSFVKALRSREDVERLNPERARYDLSNVSPWTLGPSRFVNKSVEEAYEKFITNKTLWIVREEARIVFETTQPINMGNGDHGALRDAVQDFSILVPSTNFPPVPDKLRGTMWFPAEREAAYAESSYEYFAQIFFSNGTTKEIIAGITAFQPLYDPAYASQGPTSATVALKPLHDTRQSLVNYSIEITADSGLTFFAGTKSQVVTAVVTRTGLPRTFSVPLNVTACVIPDSSPKWATEYNMTGANGPSMSRFLPPSALRVTSHSDKQKTIVFRGRQCSPYSPKVTVIMPNSTSDEIKANETVTTTSAPFTISVDVDDAHIPTFETHYETLANSLTLTLEIPWRENENVDPDDPSGGHNFNWGPQFEDDEDAWVPWERMRPRTETRRSYSGYIPAVVHPMREGTASQCCLRANTDLSAQKVLSDETGCEQRPLVHYLDEGARGPTFVDREAVNELLTADPVQRDLRAPILEPVVSSVPEGEELVFRYYYGKPIIYVGETWVKKVADKDRY